MLKHCTKTISAQSLWGRVALMSTARSAGPIEQSIAKKIQESLQPASFTVINDSHKHAGHSGNPSGAADAETHFRVEVVANVFDGKNLVQRHRMMYSLLQQEIDAGVHALQLKTHTPDEASRRGHLE